ncbi:HAMP domain-containing protein [Arthrobacter psychrolactophilus]
MDTRGQRPGTLLALFSDSAVIDSSVVQDDGSAVALTAEDLQKIRQLPSSGAATEITLSSGNYRLAASTTFMPADGKLVVGFPTAERDSTLNSLAWTTVVVSAVGLALIGLVGTIIIRRSLRPLDELSAVATTVASLPLDSGEAAITVRIPPMAAEPGTEIGDVGVAFNNMLDAPDPLLCRPPCRRGQGAAICRRCEPRAPHPLDLDPWLHRARAAQ